MKSYEVARVIAWGSENDGGGSSVVLGNEESHIPFSRKGGSVGAGMDRDEAIAHLAGNGFQVIDIHRFQEDSYWREEWTLQREVTE